MALASLSLIAAFSLFISAVLITALFYQNGRFVENVNIFRLIVVYLLILAILQITAVPTNDHLGQAIGAVIAILSITAAILRRKKFPLARLILTILLIIAPMILFWG